MRQYGQIKRKYPDTVLLFRLGDFYETFGDDAVLAAAACGITLTKRNNGAGGDMPLAGFPHHQLDTYLPRLVRAGHRVAVCEQLEDPKQAKGIVRRGVVEVVSPGVVVYDKLLDHRHPTYVASVVGPVGRQTVCGLAYADVSTGDFRAGTVALEHLAATLDAIQPAELIVCRAQTDFWKPLVDHVSTPPALTKLDDWHFDLEFARTGLLRHFGTQTLKGFGLSDDGNETVAAGVVLHYINESQQANVRQITAVRLHDDGGTMLLDASTRRNLEIHRSSSDDGRQGALVTMLDRTSTPMGARLFRWWMQAPLTSLDAIAGRHAVVRGLLAAPTVLHETEQVLKGIGDLERLMTKVVTNRATARDLAAMRQGLRQLPALRDTLLRSGQIAVAAIGTSLDDHADLTALLDRALSDEPPVAVGSGAIFRDGYNETLDHLRSARHNGKQWIADYQERERQETGITTLKIGQTGVFGYYIEVSNTHRSRVPERFERRQTLANAERYITPELRKLEETLTTAETQLTEVEGAALQELRSEVAGHCVAVQRTSHAVATIDGLVSFAVAARDFDYCEPEMHDGTDLDLRGARHPVIERLLPTGQSYVANDVLLDTATEQLRIITGPNMSGKSSYLRQVGLIVFLAHTGSFVPATSARIPRTDRIFTRVGAHDNLSAGESTFLVEMQEAANILHNATDRSLILLDEVGRGTATFDGISIAWAIAEYLHDTVGARTLFATHYHELTALADRFPRISNVKVEVKEVGDTIVFTHRVVPGSTDHSFGIHVARMAGLPPSVITTAKAMLGRLEHDHAHDADRLDIAGTAVPGQLSMFEVRDDVLRTTLRDLDLDTMTPLEALKMLSDLKGRLDA